MPAPEYPSTELFRDYLNPIVDRYEKAEFIDSDPISIPHGFDDPADIEIIGLFSALLAWGRRDILLKNLVDLCERMHYKPAEFVFNFNFNRDSNALDGFVHRTFNSVDASVLCDGLRAIVRTHGSLEKLVASFLNEKTHHVGPSVEGLSTTLLSGPPLLPARMKKHLARPSSGSACKRLCLFFRWMVRSGPVDLGIWPSIHTDQLLLPLDVHSGRQARAIGILTRRSNDWQAVLELTEVCRALSPSDPSRYDFALFGTGAAGETLSL